MITKKKHNYRTRTTVSGTVKATPQILFISSFPPRECGIATYSQDLIKALSNKFENSFGIQICPIESENEKHIYAKEVKYSLDVDNSDSFVKVAKIINENPEIQLVVIQHEFGLFKEKDIDFICFLISVNNIKLQFENIFHLLEICYLFPV